MHDVVEAHVWRLCFYQPISSLRRSQQQLLAVPDTAVLPRPVTAVLAADTTTAELARAVQAGWSLYAALLAHFRAALDEGNDVLPEKLSALRWSCHKCLLYLGDLRRYEQLYCGNGASMAVQL